MTSRHSKTVELEIIGADEAFYPEIEIEYSYLKGYPPRFSVYDGGDPGAPAEVDFIRCSTVDLHGAPEMTPAELEAKALDYFNAHQDQFREHAADEYE